ncbi:Hypothetical predicted protein [Mytilus galloprovincialis]|uniref:WSC domain-containing protein n=1 Tax=Mytilus galloprovincialis TaxID=29158 RepID=A0A8B6H222_MYTGA|nr:Hypothetical predicted protein [Mytilus galloprovincialis]
MVLLLYLLLELFKLSIVSSASYEYVGCYVDDEYRLFDEENKNNEAMSADICFDICTGFQTSYKHVYFGTQFGHECYCGDGEQLNSKPYPRIQYSECSMPCLEQKDEMCGGKYRISVYKIARQISINHSCLKVDHENIIEGCKTNQLQEKSTCVKFDSSTDHAIGETCRNQDYEVGHLLYRFCLETKPSEICVYYLKSILSTVTEQQPPTKNISIMYSCKENNLANSSTSSHSSNLQTLPLQTTFGTPIVESRAQASIPVIVVSVLVVVLVATLVLIIVFYRRRKIAKNSNSSENRQKETKTDNINSSANKIGITDINMPAIYENINDNKIINLEGHKHEGNYETLSTNRKSAEHMYVSTEHESTEPDSLTNPTESEIHTYASPESDSSQYQSLTNPSEYDIHTYASTSSIQ